MGFFDLNIPYESSASNKANRIKLATKAMELGYGGIAYNHAMKGVMSERDRCSIPLLSLSSLLKAAPSLSLSVSHHRDLLGVPRSSPFHQYTRLTVLADSLAQAQALNSGNHVLKSYDLVAVRPLNQTAFDYACEKSEVDIIAIDFSEYLPFRVKKPMVNAAISRGVYFEITYSRIIADAQVRNQMMSNIKLLVNCTRGKNLIVSSAAASVTEIRGPYDVANFLSLIGLPMERAKPCVSRNCSTLIANSLRKKRFYKETIKVEAIPATEKQDSKELWSLDWDEWDPISSGTGELHLEDLEKSLSASKEESKTVKAIDFVSLMETMPSSGLQVIPEREVASQTTKDGKILLDNSVIVDLSVKIKLSASESKTLSCDISLEQKTSTHEVSKDLVMETIDAKEYLVEADAITKDCFMAEPSIPSETVDAEDNRIHTEPTKDEFLSLNGSDMPVESEQTDLDGLEPRKLEGDDSDALLRHESSVIDTKMRDVDLHSLVDDINFTNCQINEECTHPDSPIQICEESIREDGLSSGTDGEYQKSEDFGNKDRIALLVDATSPKDTSPISSDVPSDGKAMGRNQTDTSILADRLSAVPYDRMELMSDTVPLRNNDLSRDQMKIAIDSSPMKDKLPLEVGLENQIHRVDDQGASHQIPSLSFSGTGNWWLDIV
ncbi:hypothetical protein CDL15_Pgr025035 [Punica granatum]|uniref:Uncharacterized protein n=1 Tax=Punica granatum TaxID=22663 RepID=A0A218W8N7_PUNGR|nr:hypothetical protein CDL15_Pgr025035 [Punica granatum]